MPTYARVTLIVGCLVAIIAVHPSRQALAAAHEYHVAPNGDDANAGTKDKPFATLWAAREAVRRLKYTGKYPDGGVQIRLADGRYELKEPFVLSEADSGREGAPVVYTAAEGAKPVLTGDRLITGWQDRGDGIWTAKAKGPFRQLYVNGKRAMRARSPNGGQEFYRVIKWSKELRTAIVPAEAMQALPDIDRAEFIVQCLWSQPILQIESVETQDDLATVQFRNPGRGLLFDRRYPWIEDGQSFHIENHLALLDEPGEWHLDWGRETLYYKPLAGEDMTRATVTAPRTETLIRLDGTPNRPVEHITFTCLTFEGTNWEHPSHLGVQGMQAGMYNIFASWDNVQIVDRPPSAVDIAGGRHIVIDRNIFQNLGSTAVDLRWATYRCSVTGNVFRDIAGGAVRHGEFTTRDVESHLAFDPEDPREVCTEDRICNNLITRVAADYRDNCAIVSGWVKGVRIEHNDISDLPYTAISVGWGWVNHVNVMRDNRMVFNRIENVVNLLTDGAGVYTLSPQVDTELAFNFIRNVRKSPWAGRRLTFGIYFDEGSDYIHRHHNVLDVVPDVYHYNRNGANNRFEDDRVLEPGEDVTALPDAYRQVIEQAGLEPAYEEIRQW
ncbi:MAG: hypothetical protein JXA69_16100 [Phycisphaerae bacterium]|nr:hypothetical protein [Phycisphaerae bacterium]